MNMHQRMTAIESGSDFMETEEGVGGPLKRKLHALDPALFPLPEEGRFRLVSEAGRENAVRSDTWYTCVGGWRRRSFRVACFDSGCLFCLGQVGKWVTLAANKNCSLILVDLCGQSNLGTPMRTRDFSTDMTWQQYTRPSSFVIEHVEQSQG